MKKKLCYLIFLTFLAGMSSYAQNQAVNYKTNNPIMIGGEGGWDYIAVDPASSRLYVSHSTRVHVIDLKTGEQAGTIEGTQGVHGVAVAPGLNKGFTSNGRDSSVMVFDLKTLKTTGTIRVTGKNPDAILFDPFSEKVFTFNGRSNNATVIDAKTNKVTTTIALDGKPEFSVTDGNGNVYVNIEDKSMIDMIDTRTFKVVKRWSIAPGESPSGLAYDIKNQRLFSACDNNLMVISDALSGKVIATLPIGSRVDGAAFDPGNMRAYSSNGEGSITVIQEVDPNSFKVVATVKTQPGARTMTVNPVTHHLYLPVAEFEPVQGQSRPAIKSGTFMVLDLNPVH